MNRCSECGQQVVEQMNDAAGVYGRRAGTASTEEAGRRPIETLGLGAEVAAAGGR